MTPSRARADFHAICFARHHQLSVGAVLQLPQMDKFGNPVRGEDGNIMFVEKVVMPDIRGLQFEIERYDPRLKPSSEPPPPAGPDLNSAEAIADGAKLMDLYYAGGRCWLIWSAAAADRGPARHRDRARLRRGLSLLSRRPRRAPRNHSPKMKR
jgi:hypothetical protein